MPKSADENAEPGRRLNEESDVIDLTEEVDSKRAAESLAKAAQLNSGEHAEGQDMEDEFDVLTREMPEFRMPSEEMSAEALPAEPAEEEEESNSGGLPSAAIVSGRRRSRTLKTPAESAPVPDEQDEEANAPDDDVEPAGAEPAAADDTPDRHTDAVADTADIADTADAGDTADTADLDDTADVEVEDAADNSGPESPRQDTGYDRQAVVKTIQMRAVDRDELERHFYAERLKRAAPLQDHRFAPDILIHPPRLLTTRWQEGGPRSQQDGAPGGFADAPTKLTELADSDSWPQIDIDEELVEPLEAGEESAEMLDDPTRSDVLGDEDMLELEAEPIELELDELDEAKPPPKPATDAEPKGPRRQTLPPRPPEEADAKPESELGSLVQELLEETRGGEAQADADKSGEPKASPARQKRAPNRPRGPRDTWFLKVFSEEYLRTLPRDIHRQTRREVEFIESAFDLGEGDRVLDLACGFGRHAIELTRRGHEVVGLDLSMPLLQKALNEAKRQELSIKFIHGDMRELKFDGIFSACFLWQTSFGYFDEQTNFRVLRGIHRALRPEGELLIEVLNRDHIVPLMPHRLWWEGVNCVFLEEVELDHRTSVLHTKRSFIYEDGTPPLEQNSYIRLYSAHELRQLLQAAGFAVTELSGELHHPGRFLGPASTRIVIRAQKRPPKNGPK